MRASAGANTDKTQMRLETTERGVPPVTIEAARRQVRVADDSLDDLLGDGLRRACALEEQITGASSHKR